MKTSYLNLFAASCLLVFGFVGFANQASSAGLVKGTVTSGAGPGNQKVKLPTVYLIPARLINRTRNTGKARLTGTAIFDKATTAYDEPLEDAYRNYKDLSSSQPNYLPRDQANAMGFFQIPNVPDGRYFVYVQPRLTPLPPDLEHLPGGRLMDIKGNVLDRKSFKRVELSTFPPLGQINIRLSTRPPATALFKGSTTCTSGNCHNQTRHPTWHFEQTGHKLAWSVPGQTGPKQDFLRFPKWNKALEFWKETTNFSQGTHLEIGDHKEALGKCSNQAGSPKKCGSSNFKVRKAGDTSDNMRFADIDGDGTDDDVFADIFLWKAPGPTPKKHFITIKLRGTLQRLDLPVELVYGGGVHRQRFIVSVPATLAEPLGAGFGTGTAIDGTGNERRGYYTILQYNLEGSDTRFNINRRVWRDYKIDYWLNPGGDTKFGTNDDIFEVPQRNRNSIQAECAGCHVTGVERKNINGEILVTGVTDASGVLRLDGNTTNPAKHEINVGCESCHGPGSAHTPGNGRNIVNPAYLTAARSDVVCGICHARRTGAAAHAKTQAIKNEGPLFGGAGLKLGTFPRPGISRQELLDDYSDAKGQGPKPGKNLWPDDLHSRSPRQQYSEHIKSAHYINDRILVACTDCHKSHGESPYQTWLTGDPNDSNSPLCAGCHGPSSPSPIKMTSHLRKIWHPVTIGPSVTCVACHMPGTSRPGGDSGRYGAFIKSPPFADAKDEAKSVYWQGHLNSHVFVVPKKTNPGVAGILPGKAMPIPYTSGCSNCHKVDDLQFRK